MSTQTATVRVNTNNVVVVGTATIGPAGPAGVDGVAGVVQAVAAGDGIAIGGTADTPTVAVDMTNTELVAGLGIRIIDGAGPRWTGGTSSPEGVVTAPIGSIFSRTDGGVTTALYVKESGVGNTGWVTAAEGWTLLQEFTSAGTTGGITLPAGTREARVVLISGGSGGGAGRRGAAGTIRGGGGGGAGGILAEYSIQDVAILAETFTVVVGAGGAGAAVQTVNDTNGASGTAGGSSSLSGSTSGPLVYAYASLPAGIGGSASGGFGGTGSGGPGGNPNGANSSNTGGIGSNAANISRATTGGGGGGGITAADSASAGGNGGALGHRNGLVAAGGAADTVGEAGTAADAVLYRSGIGGNGGGGGGASTSAAAKVGGAGGYPGGGGGGGGASLNGNNSGAGGAGADGYVGLWVLR